MNKEALNSRQEQPVESVSEQGKPLQYFPHAVTP
jgi:hypothetical protein